jgi:hypothetical protein
MLIGLTVENWKSFRSPVSFSMIKTRERQHNERIPRLDKYDTGILPVAAVYGGNASGKTNLFSALDFMKDFVTGQRAPGEGTDVSPFLLSDETASAPTKFNARVLAEDDVVYELSFSLDGRRVHEEKLVRVDGKHEKTLYHRRRQVRKKGLELDNSLGSDRERLQYIFQGTQDNQLFITNSIFQKCEAFRKVYDWFDGILVPITPIASFGAPREYLTDPKIAEMLRLLDTGIIDLGSDKVSPDENVTVRLKKTLQKKLEDSESVPLSRGPADPLQERRMGECPSRSWLLIIEK